MIRVPSVSTMPDETFMKHLEHRHPDDLKLSFEREPDQPERRLRNPVEWRTYHDTLHRLQGNSYDHEHLEP